MNKGVRFQTFVRNWRNCLLELVISQNRLLTNRFFKNELFQFFVGQKKKEKDRTEFPSSTFASFVTVLFVVV